jgi:hypothetical protein
MIQALTHIFSSKDKPMGYKSFVCLNDILQIAVNWSLLPILVGVFDMKSHCLWQSGEVFALTKNQEYKLNAKLLKKMINIGIVHIAK